MNKNTFYYPVLGKMTHKHFLARYWQKKPLLIRKAFNPVPDIITPDELAGMCCDERIESRLILEKGGKSPWELRRGPFKPSLFKKLPKTHWTFLVNGVDRFVPAVQGILDHFSFIPFWRIDDVMFSYAVNKGNVGAHVDNYDVFLVQMYGTREWMIEEKPALDDDFVPNIPIRLLRKFKPTKRWILEPGDMLYLPPRFPHHGVAVGTDCVTMSVGFRAPSFTHIINGLAATALSTLDETIRYTDPDLISQHPGEISKHSLEKIREVITHSMLRDEVLSDWLGTFATEPYTDVGVEPITRNISPTQLIRALSRCTTVARSEGIRFAFFRKGRGKIAFYVAGTRYDLSGAAASLATSLSARISTPTSEILKLIRDKEACSLLSALLAAGLLYME
jgi:50S ribosomal protein L16 3-hydroxylase